MFKPCHQPIINFYDILPSGTHVINTLPNPKLLQFDGGWENSRRFVRWIHFYEQKAERYFPGVNLREYRQYLRHKRSCHYDPMSQKSFHRGVIEKSSKVFSLLLFRFFEKSEKILCFSIEKLPFWWSILIEKLVFYHNTTKGRHSAVLLLFSAYCFCLADCYCVAAKNISRPNSTPDW